MFKRTTTALLVLILLVSASYGKSNTYINDVVCSYVVDGDTFKIYSPALGKQVVRIWGIDAPEKKQKFGDKATSFLSSLIVEKPLRLIVKSKDKYGRFVCQVFHEDMDIGLVMVRMGFAWHYVSITKNKALANAQAEAKRQQLGLWADPDPTPPWVYRVPKATGSVMYLREPYKIHFQNG